MESQWKFSPRDIDAIAAIASNLFCQGRMEDAAVFFRGLVAMGGNHYGDAGLGAIALSLDPPDLETAATHLAKAAAIRSNDAAVRANFGEVLVRLGRMDEAAKELSKAIELDPENKIPSVRRARTMMNVNKKLSEAARKLVGA